MTTRRLTRKEGVLVPSSWTKKNARQFKHIRTYYDNKSNYPRSRIKEIATEVVQDTRARLRRKHGV